MDVNLIMQLEAAAKRDLETAITDMHAVVSRIVAKDRQLVAEAEKFFDKVLAHVNKQDESSGD
jgi:hypothetical protein